MANEMQSPSGHSDVAAKRPASQAVTIFREILFLPLRLHRRADRPALDELFQNGLKPDWTDHAEVLADQPPSRIWAPKSQRDEPGPGDGKESMELYRLRQAYGEVVY